MMSRTLSSRIYEGWVRHRRFSPTEHTFKYKVFMMYLDLSEIDEVMSLSRFWSIERFGLAVFKRKDFMGDAEQTLDSCVRSLVEARTGSRPAGPIRVLANLRYFGYYTNPLTTYYCFDKSGEKLETIVAEVTNTPWRERHAYVLSVEGDEKFKCRFQKEFHVSPFNPLSMEYRWFSNEPGDHLSIHLENWQNLAATSACAESDVKAGSSPEKVMDATMSLMESRITAKKLNQLLIAYPFMTVKVITAIYWQALKLLVKRAPFYGHPNSRA